MDRSFHEYLEYPDEAGTSTKAWHILVPGYMGSVQKGSTASLIWERI